MSRPDDYTVEGLARLSRTLSWIAGALEDYDQVHASVDDSEYVRQAADVRAIHRFRDVTEGIATCEKLVGKHLPSAMRREAKELLYLLFEKLGQADVPAEFLRFNKKPKAAIATIKEAFLHGFEACHEGLERLAARIAVCASEGFHEVEVGSAMIAPSGNQADPSIEQDGPYPPCSFRWKGNRVELQPIPFKLLACMWDKDSLGMRELDMDVWGHEQDSNNPVRRAIQKVNTALDRAEYRDRALGTKSGHVVWR